MKQITINIDESKVKEIQELADKYGVPVEKLLSSVVERMINDSDPRFEKAKAYVLEKNKELYNRLA